MTALASQSSSFLPSTPSTSSTTEGSERRTSPSTPSSSFSSRVGRRLSVRRRVGAVVAGLVFIFVVTTAIDVVMHQTGVFPPMDAPPMSSALFALAFAYRFVIDVAGTYLTARIAGPERRAAMTHALVLGAIGVVLSVAGAIAMWNAGPYWYPIALAASSLPTAWLGGKLATRERRHR